MEGVVVISKNNILNIVIRMNNITAGTTGDLGGPDNHSEIDVVELQLGERACACRHLRKINDEGFRLRGAASIAFEPRLSRCTAGDDDGLPQLCGCGSGNDGSNVNLG
jgi:hypothetical protein